MLDELKDKYLIVPSETKKGMMVLIESQSKAASTSIEIMNIIRENRENIKNV
jgi:hypothetical protein